mmetsp:Transcript_95553/g.259342  ORF Transcript_95553/g.259342 Transcript_95553/m.259342 type:complete len:309 (-) Transcript_95553:436-1362(-)
MNTRPGEQHVYSDLNVINLLVLTTSIIPRSNATLHILTRRAILRITFHAGSLPLRDCSACHFGDLDLFVCRQRPSRASTKHPKQPPTCESKCYHRSSKPNDDPSGKQTVSCTLLLATVHLRSEEDLVRHRKRVAVVSDRPGGSAADDGTIRQNVSLVNVHAKELADAAGVRREDPELVEAVDLVVATRLDLDGQDGDPRPCREAAAVRVQPGQGCPRDLLEGDVQVASDSQANVVERLVLHAQAAELFAAHLHVPGDRERDQRAGLHLREHALAILQLRVARAGVCTGPREMVEDGPVDEAIVDRREL